MTPFSPSWQSRFVLFGRTRCGKTQLARTIQKSFPRVVVIDTVADYAGDSSFQHYSDFRSFGEALVHAQKFPAFNLSFQFSIHDQHKAETADEIFRLLFSVGHVLVVVDECQYYRASHYLSQLVLAGARHGIAVLTATQRPANMAKDWVSMASDVFVGQLFEPNDAKYFAEFMAPEDCAKIPAMPPFHFLHWRPGRPPRVIKNA